MRLPVGQYWTMYMCFTVGLCFVSADNLLPPKIKKVIYFEKNSTLEVGFYKKPPLYDFLDEYKVILHSESRTAMCRTNCSGVPLLDVCGCYYSRDLVFFLTVTNITVRLIRSRGGQVMASLKTTTGFDLYQHVCPEPVVNMVLNYVNSSLVQFGFQPSENTKRKIGLMNLTKKPLFYKVTLTSSEGHQKNVSLQAQFPKTIYWLSERGQQNVAVIFQDLDLAPNSNYTVSVSGVGGGGEGDANFCNFTTHKTAPLKPPVLPPFSFARFRSLGLSSLEETCVFMIWQPLPKEYTGGAVLHYNVNITSLGTHFSKVLNVTTHFITEKLSLHSHHITIWAANEIGRSDNFSQVTIPDSEDFRDIPFYVAFNNDTTADVFISLPDSSSFQSLAVHWCVSEKSLICRTQTICKGSLHTQHFNVPETGKQLHYFSISLVAACKKFTSESKRKITYIDFESLGDQTAETRTALANVTETEYRLETGDTCTGKDTESTTETVGPKAFFVSMKDNEGRWMGMRPARCYYHNDAKTVDVKVNQTYDEVKNIFLNIHQRCDTEPPALNAKQFLVKQFEIYSTSNNKCRMQGKMLDIIDNAMNSPVSYKLPPGLLYVCVVAVGHFNSFTISTMIVYPKATLSGLSDTAVIAVVAAIIIIILAIALGFIYKKCSDSRRYFERLWKSGSFANLKNRDQTSGKSSNDQTIPDCTSCGFESWVNADSRCATYTVGRLDRVNQGSADQDTTSNRVTQDSGCPHPDLVLEPLVTTTDGIPRHYCRMNLCQSDNSSCSKMNSDAASKAGSHETADTNDKNENNVLPVSLSGLQSLKIHETVDCSVSEKEKSISSVLLSRLHDLKIQGTQSILNDTSNCSCSLSQAGLDFVLHSDS